MKPTCCDCRYWEKKPELDLQSGLCHRLPPQWLSTLQCAFPATRQSDWCGEFEPKEGEPT